MRGDNNWQSERESVRERERELERELCPKCRAEIKQPTAMILFFLQTEIRLD